MEEGMMQIILGEFVVTVDNDTAQKILNDDVFAQQYLQQLTEIEDSQNSADNIPSSIPVSSSKVRKNEKISHEEPVNKNKVWTTSRIQTETDEVATIYFLALRKKLNHKFPDKCTAKNSLWLEIAQNMNEAGFFVGEGVEGREKCRQKFVNLQSSYMKYLDKKRSTGEGKIEKPPFYDEIDEILGEKDKANPAFLIDSLNIKRTSSNSVAISAKNKENNIPSTSKSESSLPSCLASTSNRASSPESAVFNPQSDTPKSIDVNRFKKCVKTVTPKKNEILEKFYTLAEVSEQRQKTEFLTMMELMREESQKRHEQVMTLISSLHKNNQHKKRKRDSSESD